MANLLLPSSRLLQAAAKAEIRTSLYKSRGLILAACLVWVVFVLAALRLAGGIPGKWAGKDTDMAVASAFLTPEEEYPQGSLPDELSFTSLVLEKSKRRLTAYVKGKPVRVYLVALGEQPVGRKEFQGDNKTPEGKYTINDKNPNSAYYKNVGISYPNRTDRERAQKLGKPPGGDIKIHGLAPHFAEIGAAHRTTDWTYGCIAVTNPEMEEIYTRTPLGTPIEIRP